MIKKKRGRPKGSKNLKKQIEIKKSYVPTIAGFSFLNSEEKALPFNLTTVTKCYNQDVWVRAVVEAIASGATAAGFRFVPSKIGTKIDDRWLEVLQEFTERPNEEDTFDDLLEELFLNLALYHVAYWYVPFNKNKYLQFVKEVEDPEKEIQDIEFPFKIYALSPETIKIKVKNGSIVKFVQKVARVTQEYDPDEIIYFRMPSVGEEIYSKSPIQTLQKVIASDIYAEQYNGAFFENNATPRLHIDVGNVSKEDFERIIDQLNNQLKGKPHANLVTNGNVKVTPVSLSNKDMEFSTYAEGLREKIFALWRMQPIILGLSGGTKENASQQISLFRTLVISRYQRIVKNRIDRKLLKVYFKPAKAKIKFNPLGALDVSEQIKLEEHDLKNLIKTINMIRLDRGLSEVEWGDVLLIPYSKAEEAVLSPKRLKEIAHESNNK